MRWLPVLLLLAPTAYADDAVTQARELYAKGAAEYDARDWTGAAHDLTRADALVPNAVTLTLALRAVSRTDDAVLAMTLADRACERGDPKARELGADVTRTFGDRVGIITVLCPAPLTCAASIDGTATVTPVHVGAGGHIVDLVVNDHASQVHVDVRGGADVQILASAYAKAPDVKVTREPRLVVKRNPGWSPAVFWTALAATAIGAGFTIGSGLDALSKNDAYIAQRNTIPDSQLAGLRGDGQAAELRTNVLLGVTSAVAVATAAIGIFAIRWRATTTTIEMGSGVYLRGTF